MRKLIILLFLLLGLATLQGQDSVKNENIKQISVSGMKVKIVNIIKTVYSHTISEMKISDPQLAKVLAQFNNEDLTYLYYQGQIFDWKVSVRPPLVLFGDSVGKFEKPSNKNSLLFSRTEMFTKTPAVDKEKGIFYSKINKEIDYDLNFIFLGFIFYFISIIYSTRHFYRKKADTNKYLESNDVSRDSFFSTFMSVISFVLFIFGAIYADEIGWNIWWSIIMCVYLVAILVLKSLSADWPKKRVINFWSSDWFYFIEVVIVFAMLFIASSMAMISIVYIVLTFIAMIWSSYKLSGKTFIGWALE